MTCECHVDPLDALDLLSQQVSFGARLPFPRNLTMSDLRPSWDSRANSLSCEWNSGSRPCGYEPLLHSVSKFQQLDVAQRWYSRGIARP